MTTTDTDVLAERLEDALIGALHTERDEDGSVWVADGFVEPSDLSAAVLSIMAEEVRKAKVEALREMQEHHEREADKAQTIAARGIHLTIAGSAHMRAAEYETGGTDEHR